MPGSDAFERALLAASPEPVVAIDDRGTIRSASDSIRRVFGWRPDELIGRNVNVLMPEPHGAAHDGYLARARDTGAGTMPDRTHRLEAIRKDGVVFPIELSVSRADIPGQPGPVYVGIIHDVTERVRAEQEHQLMQTLTLSIGQAGSVADAMTSTIRDIVHATGWDFGEVWLRAGDRSGDADALGSLERGACWPTDGKRCAALRAAAARAPRSAGAGLPGRFWNSPTALWLTEPDELSVDLFACLPEKTAAGISALAVIPIRSEDQPVAVLLFFVCHPCAEHARLLELTQAAVAPLGQLIRRKTAEDELARHHTQLEQMVAQRTDELARSHEQLRIADRLASIGTLAAGLGHDMNNVLLPVRARLNALRGGAGGALPAPALKHVDDIRKSVAYLQQLADGLHFLATDPDSDEARDVGTVTDLRAWWSQSGALLAKAVPKHVRVTASIPAGLARAVVQPHRLTQAVLNLVVNAGESIPPPSERKRRQGRARLWADATPDGRAVRLGVTDNGRGMDEETKRRAFEMFFTTKTRGLGTGLGLALVRRVALQAGGRVEVESEPGKGTTFTLTFPAVRGGLGGNGQAQRAVLTIGDGRTAGLVRNLLEGAGVRVEVGAEPGDADMWVTDADAGRLESARAWRGRSRHGRLVVLGRPGRKESAAWAGLSASVVEDAGDFEGVRAALGRAIAGSREEA